MTDPSLDTSLDSELSENPNAKPPLPALDRPQPSSLSIKMRQTGWVIFTVLCLLVFTVLKLPEERLKAYIQGSINEALANQGISLTASQSYISIGFGFSYTMKGITLNFPPPADPVKIDQISVFPSLLSLVSGNVGGSASANTPANGKITLSFSFPRNPKPGTAPLSLDLNMSQIDLGQLGVLKTAANLQGSAVVNGSVNLKGDASNPGSLDGRASVDLSRIVIDSQSILGFSIPRLAVSEGKIEVTFEKGKMMIKAFRIGKNPSDDLRATITGDIGLSRTWGSSALNLKADFGLSDAILKSPSLSLVDALLSPGKKADGTYSYNLGGTLTNPMPSPNK